MEASAEENTSRNAWRAMLVPAVGSAAFFAAALVNVIRTHREHGWPVNAFRRSDYLLMTIPFMIVGLALSEEIQNGKEA